MHVKIYNMHNIIKKNTNKDSIMIIIRLLIVDKKYDCYKKEKGLLKIIFLWSIKGYDQKLLSLRLKIFNFKI